MEDIKTHNILIVSASIGSGHTQAANAVRDELTRCSPGSQVTVVDFLEGTGWLGMIKETYLKMLDVVPHAYEFLYRWSQGQLPGSKVKKITALAMKTRLLGLLRQYRPDLVVFTHPFPCCAAAYLRRTQRISTPLHAIITDFATHQLWVHKEINLYFAPNAAVAEALCGMGIAQSRISTTGIPISLKFINRDQVSSKPQEPVVLIMGGGLGLGAVEQAVVALAALKLPLRLIVIAGSNRGLQERLRAYQKLSPHSIEILGYTERIPELMAQASLLITKPGALTCSEALAMHLPLVLYDPILGQEAANADYLISQGTAVRIETEQRLASVVGQLLANAAEIEAMRMNACSVARPYAAVDIADTILGYLEKSDQPAMQAG